ncbi:MAG: family 20 glycosylhydrolase [Puniceicoccaceae bacterium]
MKDLLQRLVPIPREILLVGSGGLWREASLQQSLVGDLGSEGYRISASGTSILIEASGDKGFFYARQTITQLRRITGGSYPGFRISDAPAFPIRGYMLDISRCKVPRMEQLFHLVDLLALFKFNQLQLYTEHTFAYEGHETVWNDASPMTPGEVRELEKYCSSRYIELVPNQNAFGHMERWLRHPQYRHLAESPDGFEHPVAGWKPHGSVLRPGPDSIAFVSGLLEQLLPCFNSEFIHLGCDEPWELGQGLSSERVERDGRHAVYKEHLLALHDLVSQHNRRMLFWSDELRGEPSRIREFPSDMIPVVWGYEGDHDFDTECAAYAAADHPFLIAPGDSSWNSFSGRLVTALRNIEKAVEAAQRHKAEGLLLTSWGDQGHQQTWPAQLPGLVCFAAGAWNPSGLPQLAIDKALDQIVFQDTSGQLGKFWVKLARLDSHLPGELHVPNSSFPYDAVYASKSHLRHLVRHLDHDVFFPALSQLEDCAKQLDRASPACADGDTLLEESNLALEMTRAALKRAETMLKEGNGTFPSDEWMLLAHRFRKVWLMRNREGGLEESLSRLRLESPHNHA